MTNKTFFSQLSSIVESQLYDDQFINGGIEKLRKELENDLQAAFVTAQNDVNQQELLSRCHDIDRLLEYYFGDSLHLRYAYIKNKLPDKQRKKHLVTYALIAQKGIEDVCDYIINAVNASDFKRAANDDERKRQIFTFITNLRKLGILGRRMIREFDTALNLFISSESNYYESSIWPDEVETALELFLFGFIHPRQPIDESIPPDAAGGLGAFLSSYYENSLYLPATFYGLCLIRPAIELCMALDMFEFRVKARGRVKSDGTLPPRPCDVLYSLVRHFENVDGGKKQGLYPHVNMHVNAGLITQRERLIINGLYDVGSRTIHETRYFSSSEVFLFYRYIIELKIRVSTKLEETDINSVREKWQSYLVGQVEKHGRKKAKYKAQQRQKSAKTIISICIATFSGLTVGYLIGCNGFNRKTDKDVSR